MIGIAIRLEAKRLQTRANWELAARVQYDNQKQTTFIDFGLQRKTEQMKGLKFRCFLAIATTAT